MNIREIEVPVNLTGSALRVLALTKAVETLAHGPKYVGAEDDFTAKIVKRAKAFEAYLSSK